MTLSVRNRLTVATGIGIGYAGLAAFLLRIEGATAAGADFTYPWFAARFILAGTDPYVAIHRAAVPYQHVLFYPLTAGVLAMPFAWLTARAAAVCFLGVGGVALAFALTKDSWWRLLIFASAPAFVAAEGVQWSPIFTAAAVMPSVLWLAAAKPNLALPLMAYQSERRAVIALLGGVLALGLVSLALQPDWPLEWLRTIRTEHSARQYLVPAAHWWGVWALFAAVRWRTREGRLVLVFALMPQTFYFYDQLPLLLVARTRAELLTCCVVSWIAFYPLFDRGVNPTTWQAVGTSRAPFVMLGLYLPALILTLWHRSDRRAVVGGGPRIDRGPLRARDRIRDDDDCAEGHAGAVR